LLRPGVSAHVARPTDFAIRSRLKRREKQRNDEMRLDQINLDQIR